MSELLEGPGDLELTVTDLHNAFGVDSASPDFEKPILPGESYGISDSSEEISSLPRHRLIRERMGSPGSIDEFYFQIYSRNIESFLQEFLQTLQGQEVEGGYSGTAYFVPLEEGFVYSPVNEERYVGSVLFMDRDAVLDTVLDYLYDNDGDYLSEDSPSAYGLPEESSYSFVGDAGGDLGYFPLYVNLYTLDDNTLGIELGLAPLESAYDPGRSLEGVTESTGLSALALKELLVEGTLDKIVGQNPGLFAMQREANAAQLLGVEESPYKIEADDEFTQRERENEAPDAVSVIPAEIGQDPHVNPEGDAETKRYLKDDRFPDLSPV